MTIRHLLLLFCIAFTCNALGQNHINTISTKIDKDHITYDVVDDVNNKTYLFLVSSKEVEAIQLDSSFQVLNQFLVQRPESKFKKLLGHSMKENTLSLHWSTNNSDQVISQHFDFEKKESTIGAIESISTDKEKVITAFPFDNSLFIASITKNSNLFKLYELNGKSPLKPHFFSFEDNRFYNKRIALASLDEMFKDYFIDESSYDIQYIAGNIPTAFPSIVKKRKFYIQNDDLIISFDNNKSFTQLIRINLKTKKAESVGFSQPFLNANQTEQANSNSFLFGDKIAQIKTNKESATIQISNFIDTSSPIFKKEIHRDQTIDFSTTPVFEFTNGNFEKGKEISKSNQFLNRLNRADNIGIAVTSSQDGYVLTFGGSSVLQNSNAAIIGGVAGGAIGGLIAGAITAIDSPKKNFLGTYKDKKIILTNASLDSNFNFNNKEVSESVIDKARTYLIDLASRKATGINLFKTQSKYILSFTDRSSNHLYIIEIKP